MAKLAAYRAKRDFKATPEPEGGEAAAGSSAFVVQKHAASRLHYDLRLELDGVMKSWAVAKGPSLVPGEKRLAVHVEDHPVEYNSFEGTIPKGQYGGGTVLLWDRGRWVPEEDPHRGYRKGHLNFRLEGEKLGGAWHLVRMRQRPNEKQEAWLLIKSDDEAARTPDQPDILKEMPLSVVSGRDLDTIAADQGSAVWDSQSGLVQPKATAAEPAAEPSTAPAPKRARKAGAAKAASPAKPRRSRAKVAETTGEPDAPDPNGRPTPDVAALAEGGRKAAMPESIEPCLATLVQDVPKGAGWIHEIKWDGYRLLAFKTPRGVKLATRRGHDWTARFPSIAAAVAKLPVETAILDGEAVIADENGVGSFSALQNALSDEHGGIATAAVLYGFDLLYLDGSDLRELPLEDRKARLSGLVPAGGTGFLRLGEHIEADGDAMVRSACRLGLEGVISKRRDRPYRSGRGEDWVKIKCTERQEFAILGHVPSSATPRAVGSLVLGYRDSGTWRLAGRSGTGYTAAVARDLWRKLQPLKAPGPPALAAKPTADERRGVVWAEPQLVAEIEFRGWTADDRLRHAAYKGLREDKAATEIVRERPAGEPATPTASAPAAIRKPRHGAGEVAGVPLTHPDRVLWPDVGLTKQGLAEFYEEIADWVLPHVANRPLSLVRCPGGAESGCFFQKHSWAGLSDHILRETVRDEGGEEEVLYVRDIQGMVALVQAGVLEIHPWGAGIADVDRPDRVTIDLDPGEGVAFADVVTAAQEIRERLAAAGLESFCKTTGGKGLHVLFPLSGRDSWPEVKAYAKALADSMAGDSPNRFIAKATKSARRGLIYVDYLRNGRGATAIAAYSTRARPGAPVSVPVGWEEVSPSLKPNGFTVANLSARLRALRADPWGALPEVKQSLPRPAPGRRRNSASHK
ncbi:DNA ligase D [Enterovirga sp.]|uniref:DNA ligase D n=1 Tax=Enterovirga sp. TaxID=2026350 RepID=UPI00262D3B8E|nr:DNA ligase D [Enterovirga sp.]MDB5592479.1 ligase [Enterovirga sp.]